ncbi:hypothetical protein J6590_080754 [Homalodisca vitripennis]|nr:hypothetical protein J6590_080754 [Homalodisca vitripennis]
MIERANEWMGPGTGYPFQRPEVYLQKEKTMTSLVQSEKQPYADDHRGDDVFTITKGCPLHPKTLVRFTMRQKTL